jgi:DNA-binding LytR/AlgR family response regulator
MGGGLPGAAVGGAAGAAFGGYRLFKEMSTDLPEAKIKADLLAKEVENAQKVYEMKINALDSTIKGQETRLQSLQKQLETALKQVQDLAIKALEGATSQKSFDAVREIALEQASLLGVNRGPLSESDQVFVKDGERCWFVKLADIRLFESVGNYAKVYFDTNKPLILKSLNALEDRLDERVFFRANRKHIINLHWIEKIEPFFNGGLLVELKGGEKIEISRRQSVKFKEMMSF